MTRYGLSLHRENENRLNVQHRKIQLGHTETSVSPWDPLVPLCFPLSYLAHSVPVRTHLGSLSFSDALDMGCLLFLECSARHVAG